MQGQVTPPGSTIGSHTLGDGLHIQLPGTGDGSSSSVTVHSFSRLLCAGICTRMHTCTQSPHTRAQMHAHALTGRTQALHTLGGGEVAHFEDGCPGQAQDPVCRRHGQPTTQAEGQGPFCLPAGAGVTCVSTRKRAPSGCCPRPGRQGVSFSNSWGLRLGPWPLGATGSPLLSTGPFETPGIGGSCLVSGQGWPQPSKGLWAGASHTTGPPTGQQAQSLGPTGLVTLEGAAAGGPCPCPWKGLPGMGERTPGGPEEPVKSVFI